MENHLDRITVDPAVNHGRPSIRSTRYSVESILEYLAGGDTIEDILSEFPDLEKFDILTCLAYAIACIKQRDIRIPLS